MEPAGVSDLRSSMFTWISLYEVLTLTAVGGYFTLRSVVDKRLKP